MVQSRDKMNKIIIYTQRVAIIPGYNERRDCADQKISDFLWRCGFLPIPINNHPEQIERYVEALAPSGIVLTGGNDLVPYGGDAPERDETEHLLVELALRKNIPLLGFCRGMQLISHHFGGKLVPVTGHVACKHSLSGKFDRTVNSYHNFGILDVPEGFEPLARTEDGVVEAMRHKTQRLMAVMWHPEREFPYTAEDIEMFSRFFDEQEYC